MAKLVSKEGLLKELQENTGLFLRIVP